MTNKRTSGIYRIRNTTTGKVYIGQSKNIEKRIEQHDKKLYNGTHSNKEMQKDYDKGHRFVYELVEETITSDRTTLDKKEEYFIKKYDSKRKGYNRTWGGRTDKYASGTYNAKQKSKKPLISTTKTHNDNPRYYGPKKPQKKIRPRTNPKKPLISTTKTHNDNPRYYGPKKRSKPKLTKRLNPNKPLISKTKTHNDNPRYYG